MAKRKLRGFFHPLGRSPTTCRLCGADLQSYEGATCTPCIRKAIEKTYAEAIALRRTR